MLDTQVAFLTFSVEREDGVEVGDAVLDVGIRIAKCVGTDRGHVLEEAARCVVPVNVVSGNIVFRIGIPTDLDLQVTGDAEHAIRRTWRCVDDHRLDNDVVAVVAARDDDHRHEYHEESGPETRFSRCAYACRSSHSGPV